MTSEQRHAYLKPLKITVFAHCLQDQQTFFKSEFIVFLQIRVWRIQI